MERPVPKRASGVWYYSIGFFNGHLDDPLRTIIETPIFIAIECVYGVNFISQWERMIIESFTTISKTQMMIVVPYSIPI